MLKTIRRSLAATITALASHGFSQSAPPTTELAQVMTDAEVALREIEYEHGAAQVRPEFLLAYKGPKTACTDEVMAMSLAARRGTMRRDADGKLVSVGGLWRNTTVGGARTEFDEFVKARMVDE